MRASPLHEFAIVGGGRWARVLAETLCKVAPPSTCISIHSAHCKDTLEKWVHSKGLASRIHIFSELPSPENPRSCAIVIANAARDHERATQFALASGASVLVEKPLAMSSAGADKLACVARDAEGLLAAANVFLFAEYIHRFSHHPAIESEPVRTVEVRWADPAVETRYGETKTFDVGLSVFRDVLPHVSAILGVLLPKASQRCRDLRLLRGGARVELQLTLDDVPCNVVLARNALARERKIEVTLERTKLGLDFATEPGTIIDNGIPQNADPGWAERNRPLQLLLSAFLRWIETGQLNPAISIAPALRACELIDEVSKFYNRALASWLSTRLAIPGEDESLRYALDETLQFSGPLSPTLLQEEKERLRCIYAQTANQDWIPALLDSNDRRAFMNSLAASPS